MTGPIADSAAGRAATWIMSFASSTPDLTEVESMLSPGVLAFRPAHTIQAELIAGMRLHGPLTVSSVRHHDEQRIGLVVRGPAATWFLHCSVDDEGRITSYSLISWPDIPGFDYRVHPSRELGATERATAHMLFEQTYDDADHDYLDHSLKHLGYLAIAVSHDEPIGFAIGETRDLDLPVLGSRPVSLGGLCCVAEQYRRHKIARWLGHAVLAAGVDVSAARQVLNCGRTAHPASLRMLSMNETAVPLPGQAPTTTQQEVGTAIAHAYGAAGFDPASFVCKGRGRPVGVPRVTADVLPEEWILFEPVDRAKGDTLLALCWAPNAPAGWSSPREHTRADNASP